MSYGPDKHRRRSIRLPGYDYAQPGEYFLTICAQQHEGLFGEIVADEMLPNEAGDMVASWWAKLPHKFPSCEVDAFVVMPNHVHGIVAIRNATVRVDTHLQGAHIGAPLQVGERVTLGRVVQWFKTMTTNAYVRGVKEHGWTPFIERLWQRNYYEHIVRDDGELNRIRDYIVNNPRNWKADPDNPAVARSGGVTGGR